MYMEEQWAQMPTFGPFSLRWGNATRKPEWVDAMLEKYEVGCDPIVEEENVENATSPPPASVGTGMGILYGSGPEMKRPAIAQQVDKEKPIGALAGKRRQDGRAKEREGGSQRMDEM